MESGDLAVTMVMVAQRGVCVCLCRVAFVCLSFTERLPEGPVFVLILSCTNVVAGAAGSVLFRTFYLSLSVLL